MAQVARDTQDWEVYDQYDWKAEKHGIYIFDSSFKSTSSIIDIFAACLWYTESSKPNRLATYRRVCSRNAVITSFDDWWPGVLRRCSARLEQLAIQRHCVTDTRHLQAPAEDTSVRCFPYLTDLYWTCAAQFFVTLTDVQCSWSFST